MQCLVDNGNGTYSIASPQPTDINACTAIIAQPSDITPSFYAMTVEQGTTIGTSIVLVWAIAWTFRAVIRVLDSDSGDNYERE